MIRRADRDGEPSIVIVPSDINMTRDEAALLVESHQETIARACAAVSRRHAYGPEQAARLTAWIDRALSENEYAVIRGLRFETKLSTVLTVVITMLARKFHERDAV
jgi:hypothetical protein